MYFKLKLFFSLSISFILLIISLFMSYTNINQNNFMLKSIKAEQVKLSYFANKLNHDIEKNQANILQSIVLKNSFSNNNINSSFSNFTNLVHKLENFVTISNISSNEINNIVVKIKTRIISYKAVENSLIEAIKNQNLNDIQDATIGFNSITVRFAEDIKKLIDISNNKLFEQLLQLEYSNNHSKTMLIISFLIAFILILFSIYKFNSLINKLKKELSRAEKAETQQKILQSKLLQYNDDLEEEIKKKTEELHTRIYTHFISGLPNRNQLLEDSTYYDFKQMALLNIDKFQKFNDVYGEEIGNIAIKMSADFLQKQLQNKNTLLYHIGGDEFVFVVKENNHLKDAIFIKEIENILESYAQENFIYDTQSFNLIMSAGITFNGHKKMLAYADMALKDAKIRNIQLSIFNEHKELEQIHKEDIECHEQLLYALDNDNILSYFQPINPIGNNKKPMKYESLVRLKDKNAKIIPPFNFIHVAKSNRIYDKLTHKIIQNTFNVISKYQIPCSLNISMDDIEFPETLKLLYRKIDEFEYNNLLTIELLETEEFKDYSAVFNFCTKVRSYGIKIALDDFGAGYSNFSHILKLPIDYIKIDASLISNIDRDTNSVIMVETIVGLAKKLHIETIAEYVSSKEILDVVTKLGVDYAQGYYLGKPEPIEKHLESV